MDPTDELRQTFFLECEDLLEILESGLMDLNEGRGDDETVNAVFRAVHSIKGGAGAFALEEMVRFAHKFETTLDEVRGGQLEPSPDVLSVFLRASDTLSDLVRASRDGQLVDDGVQAEIIAELSALTGKDDDTGADEVADQVGFEAVTLDFGSDFDVAAQDEGPAEYEISFRPKRSLYERGNEPTLILRALADLGSFKVQCHVGALPSLSDMAPHEPSLAWTVRLETENDYDEIAEVFEFVEDDAEYAITKLNGAMTRDADVEIVESAAPPPDNVVETPDIPAEDTVSPENLKQEAAPQGRPNAPKAVEAPKQTIRVDLERIERLINLVGELVITQAMLTQRVTDSSLAQNSEISEGLDEFKMLTRDIQESVMAIRAQPVKPLFQRMARIVREAAQATGKSVRLVTEGEGTEVDKTIVERLADPLTHMIRNAVDHGLETTEARGASNKPEEGVVRLIAAHRSGRIVIEVADDGAGINREKVREIAISKGLIAEDAALSDAEIDNLLFMPGFSTAKEVSDLSGRGVGMDVVKKAIQALGGRTSISSSPGEGTTFTISLPLTLAVLDGIVVGVADQTIVAPLNNIVETFRPSREDIESLGPDSKIVLVRGQPLPIVDAGAELGFRPPLEDLDQAVFIITETHEGSQHAMVVDEIYDQRQVVIKGLGANYGEIPGIAAATILGDGRIALILDVDVLVKGATGNWAAPSESLALAG